MTDARPHGFSLRGLLLPALLAAIAAGVVVTVLQQIFLEPLILQAENLELGRDLHAATEFDIARAAYTLLFNCLGAFGYGLLLATCYVLRGGVTPRAGLVWGLAGFASFALAPALGLPPELPGMQAADLGARQLWWVLTATTTAAGLAFIAFSRPLALRLLGVVVIAVPHIAGAPQVSQTPGELPAQMVHAFVVGSLANSALMWVILGIATSALVKSLAIGAVRR